MDPIKGVVTPPNQGDWKKRGRVQVRASMMVAGEMKRVTLHLRLSKGWFGLNPDEAAVARLDAAEKLERDTLKARDSCKAGLEKLEADLLGLKERQVKMEPKEFRAAKRQLTKSLKETAAKLAETTLVAETAKKAADKVRAEVQRTVEFVF